MLCVCEYVNSFERRNIFALFMFLLLFLFNFRYTRMQRCGTETDDSVSLDANWDRAESSKGVREAKFRYVKGHQPVLRRS